MELLLDITATAGRLAGTARCREGGETVTFSGSLELLACIERLCPDEPGPGLPAAAPTSLTSTNRES